MGGYKFDLGEITENAQHHNITHYERLQEPEREHKIFRHGAYKMQNVTVMENCFGFEGGSGTVMSI